MNFHSLTSGDEDGVILEVEAPKEAVIQFEAYMMSRNQFGQGETGKNRIEFSVPLCDLSAEDWIYSAGRLDHQIVLRRVGQFYPKEICFEWTEKEIPSGKANFSSLAQSFQVCTLLQKLRCSIQLFPGEHYHRWLVLRPLWI